MEVLLMIVDTIENTIKIYIFFNLSFFIIKFKCLEGFNQESVCENKEQHIFNWFIRLNWQNFIFQSISIILFELQSNQWTISQDP